MVDAITRTQVLAFRVRAQQLDPDTGQPADTAVLNLGEQDPGPDGVRWALANRGVAERLAAFRGSLWLASTSMTETFPAMPSGTARSSATGAGLRRGRSGS